MINASSSSNPTTLDRPRTPVPIGFGDSPKQNKDNVLQGVTTAPLSPTILLAEPSNVLDYGLPSSDVYTSLSDPGITTGKSETPIAPLRLPSLCADDERMLPISTYTPGGEPAGVGARVRRPRIQEDGGIRLAGGPPDEAQVGEDDSDGFEDLPPPYQQF